jgi:hypothetical protein
VFGVGLLGVGGWLYYQQYLESIKPPPARIVELSVEEIEATLTPQATSSPSLLAEAEKQEEQPAVTTTTTVSDPNPVGTVSSSPVSKSSDSDVISARISEQPGQSPEAVTQDEGETLSLADNPLLVVEELDEPEPALESDTGDSDDPAPATIAEADALDASLVADVVDGPLLTRIVADTIELDAEIKEVGWEIAVEDGRPVNTWQVADYAAGWHKNSSLPGRGGNVVLSGHHNIKGEVFRYIVELEPGDVVTVYDESGQEFQYTIEDKFIVKDKGEPESVRRANARWIGPFNDERLTLVTLALHQQYPPRDCHWQACGRVRCRR